MAQSAETLFNVATFGSVSASAFAVYVVVNAFRRFLGFYRKWLFLAAGLLVALIAHLVAEVPWSLVSVVLIFLNGCLLAFTAAGAQETVANAGEAPTARQHGRRKYGWHESWF